MTMSRVYGADELTRPVPMYWKIPKTGLRRLLPTAIAMLIIAC
jgi:hypothetical protein